MENKKQRTVNPIVHIVLPCVIVFTLIKAYQRYVYVDYDAALMYLISSLGFMIVIYFFTKKKKK